MIKIQWLNFCPFFVKWWYIFLYNLFYLMSFKNYLISQLNSGGLTYLPLMPHICVHESTKALVQIMAWHLFGAKPLYKPMLGYCQWTLRNKLLRNFNQNIKNFIHKEASQNIICEMAAFYPGGDELTLKHLGTSLQNRILFSITVIFLYETGLVQWIFSQQYGYWWPGIFALGHQWL